jgi:hypothetical protein
VQPATHESIGGAEATRFARPRARLCSWGLKKDNCDISFERRSRWDLVDLRCSINVFHIQEHISEAMAAAVTQCLLLLFANGRKRADHELAGLDRPHIFADFFNGNAEAIC